MRSRNSRPRGIAGCFGSTADRAIKASAVSNASAGVFGTAPQPPSLVCVRRQSLDQLLVRRKRQQHCNHIGRVPRRGLAQVLLSPGNSGSEPCRIRPPKHPRDKAGGKHGAPRHGRSRRFPFILDLPRACRSLKRQQRVGSSNEQRSIRNRSGLHRRGEGHGELHPCEPLVAVRSLQPPLVPLRRSRQPFVRLLQRRQAPGCIKRPRAIAVVVAGEAAIFSPPFRDLGTQIPERAIHRRLAPAPPQRSRFREPLARYPVYRRYNRGTEVMQCERSFCPPR